MAAGGWEIDWRELIHFEQPGEKLTRQIVVMNEFRRATRGRNSPWMGTVTDFYWL